MKNVDRKLNQLINKYVELIDHVPNQVWENKWYPQIDGDNVSILCAKHVIAGAVAVISDKYPDEDIKHIKKDVLKIFQDEMECWFHLGLPSDDNNYDQTTLHGMITSWMVAVVGNYDNTPVDVLESLSSDIVENLIRNYHVKGVEVYYMNVPGVEYVCERCGMDAEIIFITSKRVYNEPPENGFYDATFKCKYCEHQWIY